jgi:mono/diheme cytochrome c family protein
MKIVIALVAALAVALLGGLFIILSGAFNVAAIEPDSAVTEWIFHTTMRRSVAMRSSGVVAPRSFADEQVRDGFEEFNAMCVGCHGAPGRMRSAAGKGLRPRAPDLARAARTWGNGNLFWIVKNGIKMTGMPAFGTTHDDQTIWNIVAFVRQLPDMTSEQYQQLEEQAAGSGHQHEH